MTQTAKELIENEVKSVENSISTGRQCGKTYKSGVREGLMIALAHIQNSTTLVTSEETVTINKNVYDLLIDKVNKQRNQIATAVEALEDINDCTWHSKNRGIVVDTSDKGTVNLFDFTEKTLAKLATEEI